MRTVVSILAIIVVIAIIAVATGFVNLQGSGGSLPSVQVSGGKLPSVDAQVGSIDVGSKTKTVEVPKVDTVTKQVAVPTVAVHKAQ